MITSTETLVKALRILANHTHTDDGVFNACIAEAADRLEQQAERIDRLEDAGDAMAVLVDGFGEADTWREAKEAKHDQHTTTD